MKDTYKIHAKCTNCELKTSHPEEMIEIEKGTTIEDNLKKTECPNCGCNTLFQLP